MASMRRVTRKPPKMLTAANATGHYSTPLTTFDAYQYLTDLSLAAANDLVTGIPALRTQINNKYNTNN